MFNTDEKTTTARKQHRCTNCGELIEVGESYKRWVTFDDSAFTNKMHPECLSDLQSHADGCFEYSPYDGERPRP